MKTWKTFGPHMWAWLSGEDPSCDKPVGPFCVLILKGKNVVRVEILPGKLLGDTVCQEI